MVPAILVNGMCYDDSVRLAIAGRGISRRLLKFMLLADLFPSGFYARDLDQFGIDRRLSIKYCFRYKHTVLMRLEKRGLYTLSPLGRSIVDTFHRDFKSRLSRPYRWGA